MVKDLMVAAGFGQRQFLLFDKQLLLSDDFQKLSKAGPRHALACSN